MIRQKNWISIVSAFSIYILDNYRLIGASPLMSIHTAITEGPSQNRDASRCRCTGWWAGRYRCLDWDSAVTSTCWALLIPILNDCKIWEWWVGKHDDCYTRSLTLDHLLPWSQNRALRGRPERLQDKCEERKFIQSSITYGIRKSSRSWCRSCP